MKNANGELPADLKHPGGFVEEVMNYINETAVCTQPGFALGAALTLAGTLYGRRVQGDDGQRTNIFVMSVGYTSSGKDHPLKSIQRILDECNATHLRLGQVTSDSAIEWALKREPRTCFTIDEAGYFFGNASDPAAKGSPQHAIKPALLELWSSANGRWKGKQRVPRDGKEVPPLTVDNPHLCLYATTQPQILFESMSRNDLRDGWLARNIFFISKARPKPQAKTIVPIPNSIRGPVLAWKGESGDVDTTGLKPQIQTVPTTDEAKTIFAAFNNEIYSKMIIADKSGEESNYLYGKALENSRRVALILAVSRLGERAQIEKRDAEYATRLIRYLIEELIRVVNSNISESTTEKAKKRIVLEIAAAGVKGALKSDVTRRTQYLRRALRDEFLEDLIESGEIVARKDSKTGKDRYFLAEIV